MVAINFYRCKEKKNNKNESNMPTKRHPSSTATIPKWSPVYMCELVKNKHTSHTNTQSNHIHIIFPLKYILSVHSGAGPYR